MKRRNRCTTNRKASQIFHQEDRSPHFYSFRLKILPVMLGGLLLSSGAAGAASLNQQLEFLLDNGCEQLISAVGQGNLTGTLLEKCGSAGGIGGTSTGGAAGATQSAPGVVQERLLTARGEEGEMTENVSELMPGLSVFLSGGYESQDKDLTFFEDGYDSDIKRFTVGGDYQFTDKVMAGMAFNYSNHDGDFDGGGDFDNDSYGVTLFASILPVDQVFVQLTAGYAAKEYDRTRIASFEWVNGNNPAGPGPENGNYDGDEYSFGILSGYDFTYGNLSIGPRLGLDYIRTEFDGYSETGTTGLGLVFDDADETSLQSRLGLTSSVAVNTGFGVLLPQAGVNWVHEFEDDQRSESFSFVDVDSDVRFQYENEDPDRDFFEFSLGVSAVLPHGWLPYVQFRAIAGHDYLDSYVGTFGLRKEF